MVALATLPTILGVGFPPLGLTGFGTVMFVNDFAQYEAAMNQGRTSGDWLLINHFTPEPHPPALMFPLYVAMGRLASALGTGWEPIYRTAELLARLSLAGVLVVFGSRFAPPDRRRLATLLLLAGSGIGLWASLVQVAVGVTEPYVGNSSYELNTYLLFFGTPHAALGMALTLVAVWVLVEARERLDCTRLVVLAGCTVSLCLLHPFNVVTLVLAAGALLALAWMERVSWRGPILALVLTGAISGPFVVYNALTFTADPFWGATYGAQNKLPSPAPHELVVDLGVLLLGLPGAVVAWQAGGVPRRIAVVGLVLFIAMYAPVPFQRRLGFGVTPLLALLTAAAVTRVSVARPTFTRPLTHLVMALACSSTLFFYGGMLASSRLNTPIAAFRATHDLANARSWLVTQGQPSDVVLGSWDVMNYLAGEVPGRVAGGHPVATARMEERSERSRTLFDSVDRQREAIEVERARFLVSVGPHEPILAPELQLVYRSGPVVVARSLP